MGNSPSFLIAIDPGPWMYLRGARGQDERRPPPAGARVERAPERRARARRARRVCEGCERGGRASADARTASDDGGGGANARAAGGRGADASRGARVGSSQSPTHTTHWAHNTRARARGA